MKRILTATVLVPVVVGLVLAGSPLLLGPAVMALVLLGLREFFRLAEAAGTPALRLPGYAFALSLVPFALTDAQINPGIVSVSLLFLMLILVWPMLSGKDLGGYLAATSSTLLGVLYVSLPLTLLVWVCLRPGGRRAVLFTLLVVWTGDTAGYFVGRAWGKHQSSPRVSPGKTWEGTIASFLAAVAVGFAFARIAWREAGGWGGWEAPLLAAAVNVAGQWGDLAESALKRSAGVKDSSNLLPGHGGVLDRIDALLFAAPVLWYYWLWKAA